ncbi:unnamed protein product [Caenorhabditis angaria]|uniref:Uncharacterized protein n=1 Tax=Caenorhabditis angaria TaxID=860376 RepID=A0A9P1J4M9_9PELO|nr:unnamed protein product [Caenorhabditis angaria]
MNLQVHKLIHQFVDQTSIPPISQPTQIGKKAIPILKKATFIFSNCWKQPTPSIHPSIRPTNKPPIQTTENRNDIASNQ